MTKCGHPSYGPLYKPKTVGLDKYALYGNLPEPAGTLS